MNTELLERIQRIHAAVGSTAERDFSKFPARVYQSQRGRLVMQDFSGGRSEAELTNVLQSLIHNVASFHDHLQKWGERHGIERGAIHRTLRTSGEFCIIRDLWNNDKHGYPPRDAKGWSGQAPYISNVRGRMRLTSRTGNSVSMTMGAQGEPIVSDDGSSRVLVTADVRDKNGNSLGDADRILQGALRACEAALLTFGVINASGQMARVGAQ
jgi:hypothetical protein